MISMNSKSCSSPVNYRFEQNRSDKLLL